MNFKQAVTCDRCKNQISMPGGVIQYDRDGYMEICHKECSIGYLLGTRAISDFEIGSELYPDAEAVYSHLKLIAELRPECKTDAEKLISRIFE